jgi:hypothetical protein
MSSKSENLREIKTFINIETSKSGFINLTNLSKWISSQRADDSFKKGASKQPHPSATEDIQEPVVSSRSFEKLEGPREN